MRQQPFASPEEALAHFGIKGMRWGIRRKPETGPYSDWGRPFKQEDALSHGVKTFELKKPHNLRVDNSAGFPDVRPIRGFSSPRAKQIHDDMVDGLVRMREKYPNVAAMKVTVVPMSHVRGGPGSSAQAAVLHSKSGELIVAYNDKAKELTPRQQKSWERWVPGMANEGHVGNHEMGHVIAAAGKLTPDGFELAQSKTISHSLNLAFAIERDTEANHKAAFQKHGISFKEVSKLSPYAATSASEAYAELAGTYFTPKSNKQMSPEMQQKAKALFDDAGGKS